MKSLGLTFLFVLITTINIYCQEISNLPDKIDGYKVHRAKVKIQQNPQIREKEADLALSFGEPNLDEFSLTGVSFSLEAELTSFSQTGEIDFLVFKDFTVNGLKVAAEDYRNSFEMIKNKPVKLPKPLQISVKFTQTFKGLYQEWRNSKEEWEITGTVFIFGKFKKSVFKFKRVVPVEINLKIKNPLKNMLKKTSKQTNILK